jgi:hypothetical protein
VCIYTCRCMAVWCPAVTCRTLVIIQLPAPWLPGLPTDGMNWAVEACCGAEQQCHKLWLLRQHSKPCLASSTAAALGRGPWRCCSCPAAVQSEPRTLTWALHRWVPQHANTAKSRHRDRQPGRGAANAARLPCMPRDAGRMRPHNDGFCSGDGY